MIFLWFLQMLWKTQSVFISPNCFMWLQVVVTLIITGSKYLTQQA